MTYRQRADREREGRQLLERAQEIDVGVESKLSRMDEFECYQHGFKAGYEDRETGLSYVERAPRGVEHPGSWLRGYCEGRGE